MLKRIILIKIGVLAILGIILGIGGLYYFSRDLPEIMTIEDYNPPLVSEVYARGGEKIGEFFRYEKRTVVPFESFPPKLIEAFLAAEDESFFRHRGINIPAMFRAFWINLKARARVQGASTITQQVARSLLLSREKTYTRKIREIFLALQMEQRLSKKEILFLYLNEIYFGQGAYGVVAAADTYFRKELEDLTLAEMAILAGLPQAPSFASPTRNPRRAKERQVYVLNQMLNAGFITAEERENAIQQKVGIYARQDYSSVAPYAIETLRQLMVQEIGESTLLEQGVRIFTSLDYKAQKAANKAVREELHALTKRQGFRGPLERLETDEDITAFLKAGRKELLSESRPLRILLPEGAFQKEEPLEVFQAQGNNLPPYVDLGSRNPAVVTDVNDSLGIAVVRFAEVQALMDITEMDWARTPNPEIHFRWAAPPRRPSQVVKKGDVVLVQIQDRVFDLEEAKQRAQRSGQNDFPFQKYAHVTLDQEPDVEAALVSFDQTTSEVIALVGGFDFARTQFNSAIQARRQTGSAFKTIVYTAALDKGMTPTTLIQDAPMVYEERSETEDGDEDVRIWRPHNFGQQFRGDILLRTAFIRSLNVPTVRILEDVSVPWIIEYSRRLGVFSKLNHDLSLGLGSSSLTPYEMTKVFSNIGRMGRRIIPQFVHRVETIDGEILLENLSLDRRFQKEIDAIEEEMEKRRLEHLSRTREQTKRPLEEEESESFRRSEEREREVASKEKKFFPNLYFSDSDQLLSPQTAYVATSLLEAAIHEDGGTGAAARQLGRPSAGKTGSTNGYYDAWFIGYTPQIATGVWVGYLDEKSLGRGEVGGRAALPVWLKYMQEAHRGLDVETFQPPSDIVFANIDNETGDLASPSSSSIIRQAFKRGTEPTQMSGSRQMSDEVEFYREDW